MTNPANNTERHFPEIAILFLLCSYILLAGYVDLLPEYALYNEKRITQVVLLGITSIMSLVFFRQDIAATFKQLPPLSKKLLSVILFLGIISTTLHNSHYKQSLLELGLFGLLFFSLFSVASIQHKLKHHFHKIILTFLLLTAILQIATAAGGYIAALVEPVELLPYELLLNFSNPRFFNQLQSWTLPLIVLPIILFRHKENYYKYFYIGIATGWWLLLYVSGGRGTLLGIIVALIFAGLVYKTCARPFLKWHLICATSAFLLYALLFYVIPAFGHSDTKAMLEFSAFTYAGSSGRSAIWLTSWKALQSDYLFGIGPMNFACAATSPAAAHPHNALIQIAVEWGLPAALIVFFLFAWGTWGWVKKSTKHLRRATGSDDQLISIALFTTLITAAVHALFSGIIVMPHSQVMMVLVLGWMLGIHLPPQGQHSRTDTLTNSVLTLLVLASLLALITGMYPAITSTLSLDEIQVPQLPRFWQQGQLCSYGHSLNYFR